MKSLIAKRREKGAVCPKCKSPDYHRKPEYEFTKKVYECGSCGKTWSYGKNGGIYQELIEG